MHRPLPLSLKVELARFAASHPHAAAWQAYPDVDEGTDEAMAASETISWLGVTSCEPEVGWGCASDCLGLRRE